MQSKLFFPGMNGVRFFAALLVLLDHMELFKGYMGLRTLWPESFSWHIGSLGVTIFFVLSGFLITYLLLSEKSVSGIAVGNFYIRRILRIWPLYYLLVAFSFFVAPHISYLRFPNYGEPVAIDFPEKITLFSFLMANVAFVYLPTVAFANVLWSVAVEEQFYLVWPHVIKKTCRVLLFCLILALAFFTGKILLKLNAFGWDSQTAQNLYLLADRTRFSSLITGAAGAFIYWNHKPWIMRFLYSPFVQAFSLLVFFSVLFDPELLPYSGLVKHEVISVPTAVLIINMAANPRCLLRLENRLFDYLGRISYGIYVYHSIVLVICVKLMAPFLNGAGWIYYWNSSLLFLMAMVVTVGLSHLSYRFFESRFLSLKVRYSSIISGDLAQARSL